MDARSTDVLLVIIEEYVNTAEPVGSKNITDKYSLGVSSATVRNGMHQLEKDGYITSLHTSSGRIPTDKGYRFYVNYLAEKIKQKEIEEKIYKLLRRIELEDIISNVFTKLFSNNPYTSMGVVKRKQAVIESFHLLNVGSETLLIVLILKNGYSTNRLLKEAFATNLDFEIISNFLGSYLPNKTLDTINEGGIDILDKLKPESQESLHKVLAETIDMLRDFEENELYVHGIENLMNFPDFKNLSEVKCIFDAFNKRYEITEFLLNTDNDAFSVSIGDEINRPELSKLSIAKHTYDIGREGKITFGIAGPTRMDYKAVMNSLNNIENILKGMLNL